MRLAASPIPQENAAVSIWRRLVRRLSGARDGPVFSNRKEDTMRVLVIVKATKDSEAGVLPPKGLLVEMMKYNEELVRRGSCSPAMA